MKVSETWGEVNFYIYVQKKKLFEESTNAKDDCTIQLNGTVIGGMSL